MTTLAQRKSKLTIETSVEAKRTPRPKANRLIPVTPEELVRFRQPEGKKCGGGMRVGYLFAIKGELRYVRPINKTRKVVVPAADIQPIEETKPCPK